MREVNWEKEFHKKEFWLTYFALTSEKLVEELLEITDTFTDYLLEHQTESIPQLFAVDDKACDKVLFEIYNWEEEIYGEESPDELPRIILDFGKLRTLEIIFVSEPGIIYYLSFNGKRKFIARYDGHPKLSVFEWEEIITLVQNTINIPRHFAGLLLLPLIRSNNTDTNKDIHKIVSSFLIDSKIFTELESQIFIEAVNAEFKFLNCLSNDYPLDLDQILKNVSPLNS